MEPLKILWADDEIDFLKPHIMFLEQKGYSVTSVTNGDDAVEYARSDRFDMIMLDEMMPGKDGLSALAEIRDFNPTVPIIMVTKNEEERLMEEAIGQKITDYLTKPVNPSQILLILKKIFDAKKITREKLSRDYSQEFMNISQAITADLQPEEWIDIFLKTIEWEMELDQFPELGFQETLHGLQRDCNANFCRFVEKNYRNWIHGSARGVSAAGGKDRPDLSIDVFPRWVFPKLRDGKSVVFILLDCLRTDQWLAMEPFLHDYFQIRHDYYYSILPTSTPYARNAIFSGLFPRDLEYKMPGLWLQSEEDEYSSNRFEHQFLEEFIKRSEICRPVTSRYVKILEPQEARSTEKHLLNHAQNDLFCMVVNFVDILAHQRSESDILKEIAPDESAYRSLIKSWFEHSTLLSILRTLASEDTTVVITTDHGSIRGKRPTKVIGDRETSTSLRYKFGRNLQCNPKHVMHIKNPPEYLLPQRGVNAHYIMAKEDYYLIYPRDYNKYAAKYKDCFHHGGISLEEMILPVVTLEGLKR
ncbi:hypothetical protein AMJ80_01825 [bacterium SM23_31]|nr:MAG: hypothetical protein AMJ80_01825 [bacterium SM23_31]